MLARVLCLQLGRGALELGSLGVSLRFMLVGDAGSRCGSPFGFPQSLVARGPSPLLSLQGSLSTLERGHAHRLVALRLFVGSGEARHGAYPTTPTAPAWRR